VFEIACDSCSAEILPHHRHCWHCGEPVNGTAQDQVVLEGVGLINGAMPIVELHKSEGAAAVAWRQEWLKRAREFVANNKGAV
jgi:hypothetical protein